MFNFDHKPPIIVKTNNQKTFCFYLQYYFHVTSHLELNCSILIYMKTRNMLCIYCEETYTKDLLLQNVDDNQYSRDAKIYLKYISFFFCKSEIFNNAYFSSIILKGYLCENFFELNYKFPSKTQFQRHILILMRYFHISYNLRFTYLRFSVLKI